MHLIIQQRTREGVENYILPGSVKVFRDPFSKVIKREMKQVRGIKEKI